MRKILFFRSWMLFLTSSRRPKARGLGLILPCLLLCHVLASAQSVKLTSGDRLNYGPMPGAFLAADVDRTATRTW
jgi:hypothetical protein